MKKIHLIYSVCACIYTTNTFYLCYIFASPCNFSVLTQYFKISVKSGPAEAGCSYPYGTPACIVFYDCSQVRDQQKPGVVIPMGPQPVLCFMIAVKSGPAEAGCSYPYGTPACTTDSTVGAEHSRQARQQNIHYTDPAGRG